MRYVLFLLIVLFSRQILAQDTKANSNKRSALIIIYSKQNKITEELHDDIIDKLKDIDVDILDIVFSSTYTSKPSFFKFGNDYLFLNPIDDIIKVFPSISNDMYGDPKRIEDMRLIIMNTETRAEESYWIKSKLFSTKVSQLKDHYLEYMETRPPLLNQERIAFDYMNELAEKLQHYETHGFNLRMDMLKDQIDALTKIKNDLLVISEKIPDSFDAYNFQRTDNLIKDLFLQYFLDNKNSEYWSQEVIKILGAYNFPFEHEILTQAKNIKQKTMSTKPTIIIKHEGLELTSSDDFDLFAEKLKTIIYDNWSVRDSIVITFEYKSNHPYLLVIFLGSNYTPFHYLYELNGFSVFASGYFQFLIKAIYQTLETYGHLIPSVLADAKTLLYNSMLVSEVELKSRIILYTSFIELSPYNLSAMVTKLLYSSEASKSIVSAKIVSDYTDIIQFGTITDELAKQIKGSNN